MPVAPPFQDIACTRPPLANNHSQRDGRVTTGQAFTPAASSTLRAAGVDGPTNPRCSMIKFSCPYCQGKIEGPDHKAGARISCPGCKKTIQVPGSLPSSEPMIRFKCPRCGNVLERRERFAGEIMSCPSCKQSLQIPLRPTQQSAGTNSSRRENNRRTSKASESSSSSSEYAAGRDVTT